MFKVFQNLGSIEEERSFRFYLIIRTYKNQNNKFKLIYSIPANF
jgi:hypothetical protein